MKSKFVLRVLAVSGILALSATVAQAGDGGRPFAIGSFFLCQGINASAPPNTVVNVESYFGAKLEQIKIGNGVLACVVAKLKDLKGVEIIPIPTGSTTQEGLKCYGFSNARKSSTATGVPDRYTITDSFGQDPDVQASQVAQYVCAPANFILN
jgi:hypothetical protein